MGFDLQNVHGDKFSCRNKFWIGALWLASEKGWEPEGTSQGDPPNGYIYNEGAIVNNTDAKNFAEALRKVLDDIPDKKCKGVGYYSLFSGDGKKGLKNLIKFARSGAFEIW